MSLIRELQRRNVLRVAVGYLAGAWVLIQVADTVFPRIGFSDVAVTNVIIAAAVGFVPALIISWFFELTPEGFKRDAESSAAESVIDNRRFDHVIIVLLVIAVSYFAVDKFVVPAQNGFDMEKSIAVLPFVNLSADPAQEYFADGMTEELLNLLARIPELRVISRSTVFTFKGQDIVVPDVAKKLDVTHVLEGSVRKSGDRIRITAQLIDARNDAHLWSETYDRTLDDIFAIQDDISGRVVEELRLTLLGGSSQIEKIDPEIYALYLRGRHILEARLSDAYDEAEAMLREVVAAEPEFTPGLWNLGRAIYNRVVPTGPYTEHEARTLVLDLVERMAEIDPDDSYTNVWQGFIALNWDGDYQRAAHHFEKAVADDPFNPPSILRSVSGLLIELGRGEEGYALASYIVSRDPACVLCVSTLAGAARLLGEHERAARYIESTLEWQPPKPNTYWNLGVAWLVAGEPEKALNAFDRIDELDAIGYPLEIGRLAALYDLGRLEDFEAGFRRLLESGQYSAEGIARIYAWSRQNDEAFRWLERSVEQDGPIAAANAKWDWYNRIHDDPRYQAFLDKYGVSDKTLSRIEFDPPYPPELRAALDRELARLHTTDE